MTFEGMKNPQDEYEASATLHLVVDTCVWLDLGKDYRQRATIAALEQMIGSGAIKLLVPQQVIEEFSRNKARIVDDASKSLSSTFRRVKEALHSLEPIDGRDATLAYLDDANHRLATLGSSVNDSIAKIEIMLTAAEVIATCDAVKVRAAERALEKRAPFHKNKNSMGDAVLIEQYAELSMALNGEDVIAFVTHNKHDFSEANGDERKPHADIAQFFDGSDSFYSINLAGLLNEFAPDWMEDLKLEYEGQQEPRQLSEIQKAENLLFRQVWYDRYQNTRHAIGSGQINVVEQADYKGPKGTRNEVLDTVWASAEAAARRTEDEVGLDKLGPWSDYEWGMLNGKLSALRWVMGDEWDMLDT